MNEKISAARLGGWLIVAMSAPIAFLAGKDGWLSVLVVAVCGLLLSLAVFSCVIPKGKVFCIMEFCFLVAATAAVSGWSASIWPTGRAFPAVPLTLIALGAAASWNGACRASKGMGVLFWMTIIVYGTLLAFGVRNVQLSYLAPRGEYISPLSWFVFLLPCVASLLPRKEGRIRGHLLAIAAMGIVIAVWTVGNLSQPVAQTVDWPFYEAGESVRLFGIANRLESLISVGATIGFYSLYSLLFGAAGHLAEMVKNGWGKGGILLAAALSGCSVLLRVEIPLNVLAVGAFVFWFAVPILRSKIPEKNCKKT